MQKNRLSASSIDYFSASPIYKFQFEIDTITVFARRYENKIEAEFQFDHLENKLFGDFYFKNNNVFYVQFIEESSKYKISDNAFILTQIVLQDNTIVEQKSRMGIPRRFNCLGIPKDISEIAGYSKDLNLEFLEELAMLVIKKSKETKLLMPI